ncbi:MAG: aminotransferase class IV [Bacteroidales bacterium]|nr:aminotransferase class IV [Bacteroidales bacterium]
MSVQYICHNGKFISDSDLSLSHRNRAFCYGDALFETIHCLGTTPQFLQLHWERLSNGITALKMKPDDDFNSGLISNIIEKLLNKNRIFKGARIRLTVYRSPGGLYSPEKNNMEWLMESSALEEEHFVLNKKGLVADVFDEVHKPVNKLANLKTNNALIYVLAGIYRKENGLDECFILNQYGRITETISSNVFLVFDKQIITPPFTEGCLTGTMRNTVLNIAGEQEYEVTERGILEKNLLDADEVFITNAIQGIKWIGAYREKRYFNFVARKLITRLNEIAFGLL